MSTTSFNKHLNVSRVEQVVDYIENHLEDNLSLDRLSNVASVSPFHFHRIFKLVTGESTHEFVQRKRIERIATRLLKIPETHIKDLCMQYGFDNPVSFSRAFKKYYGVSASALRKTAPEQAKRLIHDKSKIGKDQFKALPYLSEVEDGLQWIATHGSVSVVDTEDFRLAYIRKRGGFKSIDPSFEALAVWAHSQGIVLDQLSQWILIIHDNPDITEAYKMMLSAGLKIDGEYPSDEKVNLMTIPAGRFLVGHLTIRDEDFKYAWDCMSHILLTGDYCLRDGYFFEVFRSNSLFDSGKVYDVDIFLPIV